MFSEQLHENVALHREALHREARREIFEEILGESHSIAARLAELHEIKEFFNTHGELHLPLIAEINGDGSYG